MKKKSKLEKISEYLKNSYSVNTPIFINEVYENFPDISPNTIRSVFKRLSDEFEIERIETGVYALSNPESIFKNSTVYASDIIKEKYLERENTIFGYIGGINFANKLGLTFQTASVETIYSNNTSNKKRSIIIRGRKIILYLPRIKITNANFKLLQILDLLNNFEKYSEYSLKESKEKIINYVKNIELDNDEIEEIVASYPLKCQVKFYKLGVYYAITQKQSSF